MQGGRENHKVAKIEQTLHILKAIELFFSGDIQLLFREIYARTFIASQIVLQLFLIFMYRLRDFDIKLEPRRR